MTNLQLRDTPEGYGLVSALLHWVTAVAFVGLFALGWYMLTLGYYDPLYITLPHWHKSLGILLMGLVVIRLGWRVFNSKTQALPNHKPWEVITAHVAHVVMTIGLVVVLCSGYLIPTAAGAPIDVFNWFEVPALVTDLPEQEDTAGLVHEYAAWLILMISTGHGLAALKHHLIDRDRTLLRMLGVRPSD